MSFWENVDYIREYRDMSRKELAYKAGFSLTSLSTGIKRNSIPSADVAYRIAKTLNVSIEYLITGKESSLKNEYSDNNISVIPYLKYKNFLDNLDSLPEQVQKNIISLVEDFIKIKNEKSPV